MIVYIYNIGVDLYNGFNGLRHRINWIYFTVLDGLAHPLYSLGMYLKFWKYLFTSNVATIFDLVFFILFENVFSKLGAISIFVATICARAISGSVGYILNRYISFQSKLNPGREMVRYSIVFVCQMAASGILVSLLSVIPIPTVIVKAIIDTILFFVVYNIQKNWVFAEK